MGDVAIVLVPATGVLVILLTHAAARLYLWRVFRARQPPGTAAAAVAPTGQRHPDGTKSELRKKIETGLERLAPILLVLFPLGWVCLVMNVRGVAGWPPFGLIFSMFFLLLAIFAAVGADPSFRRQGRYEFAVNALISKPIMAGFFAAASVSLALGSFFGAGPIGYPHNAICSASFGAFALSFALETAFDAVDLAVTRTPRRARGDLLEQQMSLQLEKPPPRCCLLWPGSRRPTGISRVRTTSSGRSTSACSRGSVPSWRSSACSGQPSSSALARR